MPQNIENGTVEVGHKWVRGMADGVEVVSAKEPRMVWEFTYYPTYYFQWADVRPETFFLSGETEPSRVGEKRFYDAVLGDREILKAAYDVPGDDNLDGLVAIRWDALDHWFEEDQEVFVHARDPYTRIDILPSTRHVRIEVAGKTVAESTQPRFLFETRLPRRTYIPKTDVDFSLLAPTETRTSCPYKGHARYWSVTVDGTTYDDIVWGYDTPLPESQLLTGLVAFYDEKVDVYVDGEIQGKPQTKWG